GIQATTAVITTAATLVSVAIAPQNPTMTSGQVLQLQLIGTYTDNSVADVAANAVWSSSNTSVATFNPNQQANSGLLSALAAGTTTLSATFTNIELQAFDSSTMLTVTGALATNPQAPELGVIAGFVLAASQGISMTAGSTIANGDVAIIDGNRAAFVGFTPGANVGQFNELTNGLSYAKDDLNPPYLVPIPFISTADFLSELKVNLLSVSTYLVGLNPAANTTTLDGPELGGLNLNRGVYHLIGDASVSQGSLNLDAQGDANSVFIISITGNLSTAPTGNIFLLNGAQASNVFWRIGGTTTIGANNQFAGNVVSTQNIQLQTGATTQGRLISIAGNIQLDANSISKAL
ncbi:MAG: ice-binding family protein, partial [Rheinheimera sp.]